MELYEYKGSIGYFMRDIKEKLTEQELEDFLEFMAGQTVGLIGDKTLVYKDDYDRWFYSKIKNDF